MADGDERQQQRYWFPYWSGQPVRPPAPRRPSGQQVAPSTSSPRRAPRGGAAAAPPSPPAPAPRVSRPSPSRGSPLAPIREPPPPPQPPPPTPNTDAAPPAKPLPKPVAPLAAVEREAPPKLKDVDIVVPREKSAEIEVKPPAMAADDKDHKAPKDKDDTRSKKHKESSPEKKESSSVKEDKKKEKEEKEKDKEKKHHHVGDDSPAKEKKHHHVGEDSPEKEKKHHHAGEDSPAKEKKNKKSQGEQGKPHEEIKAGVAHKASGGPGAAAGSSTAITLAGKNKGASMKVHGAIAPSTNQPHGHGRRLDGSDDGMAAAAPPPPGEAMRAVVNSNVQVMNNSLLFQSSCSGGDPGVHLKLSAKSKSKDKQRRHAGDVAGSTAAAKK